MHRPPNPKHSQWHMFLWASIFWTWVKFIFFFRCSMFLFFYILCLIFLLLLWLYSLLLNLLQLLPVYLHCYWSPYLTFPWVALFFLGESFAFLSEGIFTLKTLHLKKFKLGEKWKEKWHEYSYINIIHLPLPIINILPRFHALCFSLSPSILAYPQAHTQSHIHTWAFLLLSNILRENCRHSAF